MQLDRVIAVRTNKTVYRTGDKVIKVFNEDFSKADILNEALNDAMVEQTSLNVPGILGVTVTEEGKWCIISEFIKGKTLARLMEEYPERKDDYLSMFINIQRDIHTQRLPRLGDLRDKLNRKISMTNLDATTRYELHTRLDGMPKGKCVCHGDFNPSNIIINEEGVAFILDWAHVTQGNPDADAARTYLLFYLDGKKQLAEEYLSMYAKKTDTAKQIIQKWIPVVAASQLVKGKKEEKELLLKWINVVDYE